MSQCSFYDFSTSDFILMIGGQLMLLCFIITVLYFGIEPRAIISFPADEVRKMISTIQSSKK
jgi:NADH:ubiquinone oxidoreductase subunit 4 (subunit M)